MSLTLQELRKRGPRVGTFVRKFYDKEEFTFTDGSKEKISELRLIPIHGACLLKKDAESLLDLCLAARRQCVSRPDVICVQLYIELRTKGVRNDIIYNSTHPNST